MVPDFLTMDREYSFQIEANCSLAEWPGKPSYANFHLAVSPNPFCTNRVVYLQSYGDAPNCICTHWSPGVFWINVSMRRYRIPHAYPCRYSLVFITGLFHWSNGCLRISLMRYGFGNRSNLCAGARFFTSLFRSLIMVCKLL